MHDDGTVEDGTLRHCWGCGVDHYSTEEEAPRDIHWKDLCHVCIAEYFEGRERGALAVKEGRSDFERRSMPGAMRIGYMAGRFMQSSTRPRGFTRDVRGNIKEAS